MSSAAISELDRKTFQPDIHCGDIYADMKELFDCEDFMMNQPMPEPLAFDIGEDTGTMMDRYMLDDCDLSDFLHQSELHHSDSSDSGVNMMTGGMQIKQETQSNPSSPSSECGSEGYISGQDTFISAVVKTEDVPMMAGDPSSSSASMSDFSFFPLQQSTDPSPFCPPVSSSSSPVSPTTTSLYQSPVSCTQGDQTLILIPREADGDMDPSSAAQLLLPSDLSQFPGSVLSPASSSSSSSPVSLSSSVLPPSELVSSTPVVLPCVPAPLDYIMKQKVQILPKPCGRLGVTKVRASAGPGQHLLTMPVVKGGKVTVPSSSSSSFSSSSSIPVVAPKVELKPVSVKPAASSKKLVLTPDEFTKLTASGALRFQPPSSASPSTTATTPLLPTTAPRTFTTTTTAVPAFTDFVSTELGPGLESAKSKRQQRMIKNRESASLSRRRKKEYLTTLEEKVREYTLENQKLKMENKVLKTKVQHLHDENVQLRQSGSVTPRKKALLLAVAFLLALNINPFSSGSWWEEQQHPPVSVPHNAWLDQPLAIRGRHLLSMSDNSVETDASSSFRHVEKGGGERGGGNESTEREEELVWRSEERRRMLQFDEDLQHLLTRGSLNESLVAAHFCPIYFNSTESSRLAEQLRGWMIREEEVKQKKQTGGVGSPGQQKRKKKAYPPVNILRAAMRGHFTKDIRHPTYRSGKGREEEEKAGGEERKFQVQLFQHSDPRQRLLNAIPRRNDTFYILSFNTDYFLVPATAHNTTARPRMSLVMPVVSETLNDTMQPPEGSVGMMQIDCEIVSTQLINVKRSVFPQTQHHRQQQQQQQHHQQQQQQQQQEPGEPSFSSQYRNNTAASGSSSGYHGNATRQGSQRGVVKDSVFQARGKGSGRVPPSPTSSRKHK